MKKIVLLIVIVFSLYGYLQNNPAFIQTFSDQATASNQVLASAFENHTSNVQVDGSGVVIRNLADDTSGSRHQKIHCKAFLL